MKRLQAEINGWIVFDINARPLLGVVTPATRTHERQADADSVARVHLSRNSWRNVVKDRVRLIEQKDIGATLARRVATIY